MMIRRFLIFLLLPFLVGAAPSRLYTYTPNTTIESTKVTANEDALFNYLQAGVEVYSAGTILNAAIAATAAIDDTKLDLATIAQNIAFNGTSTFSGNVTFAGVTIANLGTVTTADINGGTWQGTIDGNWTAASQTCADLGTVTTANIDGGTIDGVQVAGATATGSIFYNDASDDIAVTAPGATGTYLGGNGVTSIPTWKIPPGIQSGQDLAEQSASSGAYPTYATVWTPALAATTPNMQFYKTSSMSTIVLSFDVKVAGAYNEPHIKALVGGSVSVADKTSITDSYQTFTDSIDISGLTDNAWYTFVFQASHNVGAHTFYVKNVKFAVY